MVGENTITKDDKIIADSIVQEQEVNQLLSWLKILNEGRVKPDRSGAGVVRDAKDYMPLIRGINNKLEKHFSLKIAY